MRIAVVCQSETEGGAERLLTRLYHSAETKDTFDEVTLFGSFPSWGDSGRGWVDLGLSPKWSRRTIMRGLLAAPEEALRVYRAVQEYQPDVIHMQFKREQIAFTSLLSKVAPVVWTEHGALSVGQVDRYLGVPYQLAARSASAVVTITEAVQRELTRYVDLAKLRVVPNGVDVARFATARTPRQSTAGDADSHGGSLTVSLVGRLVEAKGIRQAIEAAIQAGVHLIIAGEGPLEEYVREQAAAYENIHFYGFTSDPGEIYAAADALLLTSISAEGLPTTLLEAAAAGVPTVCFPESQQGDLVAESGGWVVQQSGLSALLRTLEPAVCRERGVMASEWVQDYSVDAMRARYKSLFDDIISAN